MSQYWKSSNSSPANGEHYKDVAANEDFLERHLQLTSHVFSLISYRICFYSLGSTGLLLTGMTSQALNPRLNLLVAQS